MKNLNRLSLLFFIFFASSCTQKGPLDFHDPENVSGGQNIPNASSAPIPTMTPSPSPSPSPLPTSSPIPNPSPSPSPSPTPAPPITFRDIDREVLFRCISCHNGPGGANGVDLSSYDRIMDQKLIFSTDASRSKMYKMIDSGRMPPAGLPPVPADKKKLLFDWIQAGALE